MKKNLLLVFFAASLMVSCGGASEKETGKEKATFACKCPNKCKSEKECKAHCGGSCEK